MCRITPILICSILGVFGLFPTDARAAEPGTMHSVRYEPSKKPGELVYGVTYRVWIPAGVENLRGVIVHQHGCGKGACEGGRTAADDLHWQALAKKWNCALLGPSFEQADGEDCRLWCDPRNGSRDRFLQALNDLAEKSGHPELASVPWCLWGHSGGAFWSSLMMASDPQRIVAVWLRSGTAFAAWEKGEIPKPEIPQVAFGIPTMCNPGLKERDDKRFAGAWTGSEAMFQAYRAKSAPIGFAPDPKTSHECGDSRYMAIPFFDACLKMRLGDSGNVLKPVDLTEARYAETWESPPLPAGESKDQGKNGIWLPNGRFAAIWASYVKTASVADDTPPPAPSNLTVVKDTDGRWKLKWSVDADLESGLAGFEILNGDEVIARLPEKPVNPFGKPLFQGMSYHDTPREPLAEMTFVDTTGKAEKPKFAVRSINTAGLRSALTEAK